MRLPSSNTCKGAAWRSPDSSHEKSKYAEAAGGLGSNAPNIGSVQFAQPVNTDKAATLKALLALILIAVLLLMACRPAWADRRHLGRPQVRQPDWRLRTDKNVLPVLRRDFYCVFKGFEAASGHNARKREA
jgi:hypothetical protein